MSKAPSIYFISTTAMIRDKERHKDLESQNITIPILESVTFFQIFAGRIKIIACNVCAELTYP